MCVDVCGVHLNACVSSVCLHVQAIVKADEIYFAKQQQQQQVV